MLLAVDPRFDHLLVVTSDIRELFDVEGHLDVADFHVGEELLEVVLDELAVAVGFHDAGGHYCASGGDFEGIATA